MSHVLSTVTKQGALYVFHLGVDDKDSNYVIRGFELLVEARSYLLYVGSYELSSRRRVSRHKREGVRRGGHLCAADAVGLLYWKGKELEPAVTDR